jgi:general secretion pathway protein D
MVKVFQPLVGQGKLLAHGETNTLILSAPAPVIREILDALEVLDVQSQRMDIQQTYVYYVNNAKASELANILMTVFGEGNGAMRPVSANRLPPGTPGTSRPPPTPPRPGVSPTVPESRPPAAALQEVRTEGEIRIVPDDRINALIIKATSRDYEVIKGIIKKLDITPKQVVIEALVAEVTLTDDFASSVEQFIRAGDVILQSSFGKAGPLPGPGFLSSQGFTLTFVDRDRYSLFLNTIAAHTKVNTLASPHILTQDNKRARIQIGQEVPIVTGTQSTVTAVSAGGSDLFQTIQQKDIGRILSILPHVNEKRQVTLDIELEASETAGTGVGGSPIFNKRTVETSVILEDGQSLLIGGIISENKTRTITEVPFLGKLPVFGRYFRTKSESVDKTELLILLTPHVIANPEEGRALTERFKKRLDWLEGQLQKIPPLNGNGKSLERDSWDD